MPNKKNNNSRDVIWRFFSAGGFDQVRLETAAELLALDKLDQKLWVALACPVSNVHFDKRTLQLIDTDSDGRIRAGELIAAIKWAAGLLADPELLVKAGDGITADAIKTDTAEGGALAATFRRALEMLGKTPADSITVADTLLLENAVARQPFNGDGVITDDATSDEVVKRLIGDIISIEGAVADRSANPGVDASALERFYVKANAAVQWAQVGERYGVRPLGDATTAAAAAIVAVRKKIDDYFTRCAIARFDDRSAMLLNGNESDYSALGTIVLDGKNEKLAALPIAKIGLDETLPLTSGVNPAWQSQIDALITTAVTPVLGARTSLSSSDWDKLTAAFAPWFDWHAKKPTSVLDALPPGALRMYLAAGVREQVSALIERDKAEAATWNSLVDLERLVRYRRDLYRLCTNFVNFRDFYQKGGAAIFQAGILYLDQRSCNLCIRIDDVNKHSGMAAMAGTCLVYCDCSRKAAAQKMTIVAAMTNGDSENLMVGRNGVFYDRDGNDWDASVVKIIDNPISIRQAFWLPYKGLVRMIEAQVAKRAMAADAQSAGKLANVAESTANVDLNKPPKPSAAPVKIDVGTVAALGVAVGAIGTFMATLFGYAMGIVRLGPFAIVGAALGVLALISGPSIVLAYIKLRKRNLSPLLDAGGWAINAKARISVPFGEMLTDMPTLPRGSRSSRIDPFADRKSPWLRLFIAVLLLYLAYAVVDWFGFVNEWTGGRFGREVKVKAAVEKTVDSKPDVADKHQ